MVKIAACHHRYVDSFGQVMTEPRLASGAFGVIPYYSHFYTEPIQLDDCHYPFLDGSCRPEGNPGSMFPSTKYKDVSDSKEVCSGLPGGPLRGG
jgi:hypothetical protein